MIKNILALWIVWIPVWYQAAIRTKMEFPDYGSHSVLLPPRLNQSLELPVQICTDPYRSVALRLVPAWFHADFSNGFVAFGGFRTGSGLVTIFQIVFFKLASHFRFRTGIPDWCQTGNSIFRTNPIFPDWFRPG
jgi:hypothetical protein